MSGGYDPASMEWLDFDLLVSGGPYARCPVCGETSRLNEDVSVGAGVRYTLKPESCPRRAEHPA